MMLIAIPKQKRKGRIIEIFLQCNPAGLKRCESFDRIVSKVQNLNVLLVSEGMMQ